jgi:pyruvate/2-oxoglutarate dehydrogenase complex dihydrolipoamide acyltransferase (E2) component
MAPATVFAMPDLGEGLEEGEIVAWLVAEGATVELNQPLVEVETAKATVEIPSPHAGIVAALHGAVGEIVPVGSPLVTFDQVTGAKGATAAEPVGGDADAVGGDADAVGGDAEATGGAEPARATPPVRKLAKELGIDLTDVAGTGPGRRITADDVRAAAPGGPSTGTASPASTRASAAGPRAVIAANLERQAAIPQVTTFRTLDCTALEAFRAELGVSPLPLIVSALCRTVESHPAINAWWDGDGVVARTEVHVGIAADTERGLVVPVVRDAHTLGIAALTSEIARLAGAARTGSLAPRELTGATIAVSNTGSYGSEAGTPILSPGASVTLAIGVIAPRALVVEGQVAARPACTLSCTFDHRVLDGATVGRALTDLVAELTSSERLGDLPR